MPIRTKVHDYYRRGSTPIRADLGHDTYDSLISIGKKLEWLEHGRTRLDYRKRVALFEATFTAAFAWPASLVYAALSFLLPRRGLWNKAHYLLDRVDRRGPLFRWWRIVQEARLRRLCEAGEPQAAAERFPLAAVASEAVACLVLKTSRPGEKGILLLKYTERLDAFRRTVDMHALLKEYRLVLEPSWSGYADPRILAFTAYREYPIFVMSSSEDDTKLLRALGSNLVPLALGASDWVHPGLFRPLPETAKKFDAVLIARWTIVKRHHLLLRALREMGDSSFRVAMVASNIPGDRDRGVLLRSIEDSGFGRQIEIFEDLRPVEVNEVLNRSKVNLLLSRQEGSNRSLFEGFFADVPGVAFANQIGIQKRHFTPETGRLIRPDGLAEALQFFRSEWTRFQPREWAITHISPERSTETLNEVLERAALARGERWTCGAVAKCNVPNLDYYPGPGVARGFPTGVDLLEKFSITGR